VFSAEQRKRKDVLMAKDEVGVGVPNIQLSGRQREVVLFAVLLGLFLGALDQTVVGTALPRIVTDLHGNGLYTWVVTAYLLTSTITVPIYGKLSDVYGRKIMLIVGICLFLAGSWLSGLSRDMTFLIVFRGLQGLGAGALFPIALAIIGDLFTPRERGRYQGLFGAVFGLSFIIGPFVGGWFTDNISWRWVFYVNMPLGIATLIVIALVLPNFHPPVVTPLRNMDFLGIFTFMVAIVPILLGLTNKGETNSQGVLNAWTDPSVGGLLLLGLIILAIFMVVEARAVEPIIPLSLFKSRTFTATNIGVFFVSFGMFAAVIFLPRWFQAVKGISATQSGYMIWPLLVGLIGSSIGTGLFMSKTGRYKEILVAAMALFLVGSFLLTHMTTNVSDPVLWFWMFVLGIGIGPSMSGFTVVVQSTAQRTEMGVATSTLTFLRQIGGSVGLAIAGTLFSQNFTQKLPGQLLAQGVPASVVKSFKSAGSGATGNLTGVNLSKQLAASLPPKLHPIIPHIVAGIDNAFSLSVGNIFWLTVASGVLAFVAVVAMPNRRLRGAPSMDTQTADYITGAEVTDEDVEAAAV
jgi:EmrB/QacA subfamily drug resistance transporter